MSSFAIYGMHIIQNYQFLQNTATLCPRNQETYERENIANFWPNSIFLNMTGCLLLQFLGSIHNTVQKISASSQLQPLPPWELPSREKLGTLVSAMEKNRAFSYQHDSVLASKNPSSWWWAFLLLGFLWSSWCHLFTTMCDRGGWWRGWWGWYGALVRNRPHDGGRSFYPTSYDAPYE